MFRDLDNKVVSKSGPRNNGEFPRKKGEDKRKERKRREHVGGLQAQPDGHHEVVAASGRVRSE